MRSCEEEEDSVVLLLVIKRLLGKDYGKSVSLKITFCEIYVFSGRDKQIYPL